jgi:hypothetical protein
MEVVKRIEGGAGGFVGYETQLEPILGTRIQPPQTLTILNGSPRGRKGNTPILLQRFAEGFASVQACEYQIHHLNRIHDLDDHRDEFAKAECIWLGFPLYTDAMPGLVKNFIESLRPLAKREINPPMGFLVQSGFPEALHSRYVERYLQKLSIRLRAPYLGTIVKGGGEGVRMMSEDTNVKLFAALRKLGQGLALEGMLDPEMLDEVAGVERYPRILAPVFKIFTRTRMASWYWDSQLKKNGVYEERFAKPYAERSV